MTGTCVRDPRADLLLVVLEEDAVLLASDSADESASLTLQSRFHATHGLCGGRRCSASDELGRITAQD